MSGRDDSHDWLGDPRIADLAKALHQGAVIAYPTEAVWGLGCDPYNEAAVTRLLAMKNRARDKGLILAGGSIDHALSLTATLSEAQNQQLAETWPGPNTWLIPDERITPEWIRGEHKAVAVRVSAHPLVEALCKAFGGLIVSTSANPQGLPPAENAEQVIAYFADQVDAISPGAIGSENKPSSIRDLVTGARIR